MNVALRTLSICTGGTAGLELGLRIACRRIEPLCYVEREKTACETLVTRFEDGSLDEAPIWSDLSTFDGRPLRGMVDVLSAGLPCQPYSVAGKRIGHGDERAIWPEFIRVVGESRPWLVWLENVPEFLKHFRVIGEKLSALGYRIEEPLFIAAKNVGASHKRVRVFILAYLQRPQRRPDDEHDDVPGRRDEATDRSGGAGENLADAGRERRDRLQPDGLAERGPAPTAGRVREDLAVAESGRRGELRESSGGGSQRLFDWSDAGLADAVRDGSGRPEGETEFRRRIPQTGDELEHAEHDAGDLHQGSRRTGSRTGNPDGAGGDVANPGVGFVPLEIGRESGRNGTGSTGAVLAESAIAGLQIGRDAGRLRELETVERSRPEFPLFAPGPEHAVWRTVLEHAPWLSPAVESGFRCLVDGTSVVVDESRTDQLRALGNGVVPLQSAVAFTLLVRKAGIEWMIPHLTD